MWKKVIITIKAGSSSCRTLSGRKQEFSEDNKFILICSSHRQIIRRPVMIILLVMTGHELMIRGKGGPPPFDRLFVATRSTLVRMIDPSLVKHLRARKCLARPIPAPLDFLLVKVMLMSWLIMVGMINLMIGQEYFLHLFGQRPARILTQRSHSSATIAM